MPRNFSLVAERISSRRTRDAAPRGIRAGHRSTDRRARPDDQELADLDANDYAAVSF